MSSASDHEEEEVEMESADENEVQSDSDDQDLAASATESDEDGSDEVDDDEDVQTDDADAKKLAKKFKLSRGMVAKVTNIVMSRNAKRQGKQLFLRFPEKLPIKIPECHEMVKALSPLITKVHRPRQPTARFCLVDFETLEDRDKAFELISKNDQKIVVAMPKVDDDTFVKNLIAKKLKTRERKLMKTVIKKETKKQTAQRHFTTTIVILNAPPTTSMAQLKELFPDAVDIQTKPSLKRFEGNLFVSVTFPTTHDAKKNYRRKLELEGKRLIIRFNRPEAPKEQMPPKKANKIKKEKTEVLDTKVPTPAPVKADNGHPKGWKKTKAKTVPNDEALKPLPINKKNNPIAKKKNAGKPNNVNKQKNQPQKKGKSKGPLAPK